MTDVSSDGQSCEVDCTSSPGGVGLHPTDTPVCVRVTGGGRPRPVTTGESTVSTDILKRMEVENLLEGNGLEPGATPRGSAIECIPSGLRLPELVGRSANRDGSVR